MIEIYTDGSAHPNPGPGGFGVIVLDKDKNFCDNNYQLVEVYSKQFDKTTNNEMELKAILYAFLKYGVNKDNMIAMQLNLNAEMRYTYLDEQGNSIKETRTATGKIIFVNGISYSDITLKLEGSEGEEHIKVMGEGDHGFYLGNKYLYTLEDLLQIEHNFTYMSATVMAVRGHHMHNHIIDYEKSSLYDFGVESDSPSSNYTKYFLDGDTFYMEIRPDDQALIEEGDIKDQKLVVQYKGKYIKDSLAAEEVDMYRHIYRKYPREVDGVSHTMIIENKKRVTFKLGTPITITAPDTTGYIQE